jgi:MFS family permease
MVGAVAVVALAASGVRSTFGVFIKPIEAEFGWDRMALSVVASVGFIFNGAAGPVMGRLADRWGPRGVLGIAAVLLGVGTLGAGVVVSLWQLYLTVGLLMAIARRRAALAMMDEWARRKQNCRNECKTATVVRGCEAFADSQYRHYNEVYSRSQPERRSRPGVRRVRG